jgi:superfamily II DNA/RNA helicase
LLEQMLQMAAQYRNAPDAKVLALLAWIRKHQCAGVELGGAAKLPAAKRAWAGRRLIVFTEYGDTKRYLLQLLRPAFEPTDLGDARVMHFHGGMSDEGRDEVQRAFNGPPETYPVRILVATDAAREEVNLQGHCADLLHFDIRGTRRAWSSATDASTARCSTRRSCAACTSSTRSGPRTRCCTLSCARSTRSRRSLARSGPS